MILKESKWVKLICEIEVGDIVRTNFSIRLCEIDQMVDEVVFYPKCESGAMVKLSKMERPIDSNWITHVRKPIQK